MGKIKTKAKKKPMTQPCRSSHSRSESILIKDCPSVEITRRGFGEGAMNGPWSELRLGEVLM